MEESDQVINARVRQLIDDSYVLESDIEITRQQQLEFVRQLKAKYPDRSVKISFKHIPRLRYRDICTYGERPITPPDENRWIPTYKGDTMAPVEVDTDQPGLPAHQQSSL
jgi:hypothetical protein